jgi:hypothetical protein
MLVKPMNTEDLLRQIEVLLIQHEDAKQKALKKRAAAGKNGGKGSDLREAV